MITQPEDPNGDMPDWNYLIGRHSYHESRTVNSSQAPGNDSSVTPFPPPDFDIGEFLRMVTWNNETDNEGPDLTSTASLLSTDELQSILANTDAELTFGECGRAASTAPPPIDEAQSMDVDAWEKIASIAADLQSSVPEIDPRQTVQMVVNAIWRHPNPTMRMISQPRSEYRFRYGSEGRRYVKALQDDPIHFGIPVLDDCLQTANQTFWVRATIVTNGNNPRGEQFIHPDRMTCMDPHAIQNGPSSFLVQLTEEDIRQRSKTLRRIAVTKTLDKHYTFQLVLYDPSALDAEGEPYTLPNEHKMTHGKKAKAFKAAYNINQYQIVFQLAIKQGEEWFLTNVSCETHVFSGKK